MNRVYFGQNDKRWANHPYTSTKHPKALFLVVVVVQQVQV